MHTVKNLLLILLTLTLVAVGALAPYGTAIVQDRRLESNSDMRELSGVQLIIQKELSAAQVLNILGGEYTTVEWNAETNLIESAVKEYAFDVLWKMMGSNLIPENAIDGTIFESGRWVLELWDIAMSPFLVISNGENQEAFLLWECTWESPGDAAYTMWIDDATGTMYGIGRTVAATDVYMYVADVKYLNQYMEMWVVFLRDYYGFQIVNKIAEEAVESNNEGLGMLSLALEFGDTERTCKVQLTLRGWNVSFLC